MKEQLIKACRMHAEGDRERAKTNIMVYMNQSVGIGEHPQHLDEIDKQLAKIVEAEEKQNALQVFKL